ncbi:hypothetical protein BLNAU_14392 [Blattamonas nauphoetae]|uniref:Uncharacterized protein n=1 Tax=Blattamonas nauphoetae TaxID=2049346 RepID=A0ABQ9XE33_9EUKA|nr:hypothetical protein BLNAU_14392 [Blattamonas nauphoetae]
MSALDSKKSTSTGSPCPDCSAFLNWDEESLQSFHEAAVVFWSLVATVKLQSTLDDTLEGKAVNFLQRMDLDERELADAFLVSLGQTINESSRAITTATMKMLQSLIANCSRKVRLALVKADLIPQLITTLNPQSLSFTEALDIHTYLMINITNSLGLATPNGLGQLGIEDDNEQEAVHETVLQQVVTPSEKYIWHLCMNRFSIVDGNQSRCFLALLARLLRICPYYQPTMDIVLQMPIFIVPNHLLATHLSHLVLSPIQPLPTFLTMNNIVFDVDRIGGCAGGLVTNGLDEIVLVDFDDVDEVARHFNPKLTRASNRGRLNTRRARLP